MSAEAVAVEKKRNALANFFVRLVKEKPLGTFGGVLTLVFLVTAISCEFIAPYGMNETNVAPRLASPSVEHILGADHLGRDTFSRIVYGARISVTVGLASTTLSIILSTVIGVFCGYIGGKFDLVVQRFVDAWMAFPGLILLILAASLLGPGMWQVIVILALSFGIAGSRIVRSAVISIKGNMYVDASQAIGCSTIRVIAKHILPNIIAPIIILYTTRVPAIILAEASLSFLGLGIPPPTPSWGGMLSGAGRRFMMMSPWLAVWPGLALATIVYGVNMFGDAIRDLLDPRMMGGVGRFGIARATEVREVPKCKNE